jgi:hypothetical protein
VFHGINSLQLALPIQYFIKDFDMDFALRIGTFFPKNENFSVHHQGRMKYKHSHFISSAFVGFAAQFGVENTLHIVFIERH